MADAGLEHLSEAERERLAALNDKQQSATGLTEEEQAKIAEDAEAAEAEFVKKWGGALLLGTMYTNVLAPFDN